MRGHPFCERYIFHTQMTDKECEEFMERMASQLAEYFDAVQIIGSRLDSAGCTRCTMKGAGNWYARKAMCQEFVERDQARTVADAIKPEES